ncbi:MAG: hypothetical protein JO152_12890 [Mycobacteriaceae bacterium]|nr:hypothetical protein [Mycobacteriaceae bacterium]MBV9098047.1 hypothetical protein [Frankiaceae bacterium]
MSSLFRDPVPVTYVDPDNNEIVTSWDRGVIPRAGENVRIAGVPYVVERVGYDVPADKIERVWIVLRRA